MIRNFRESDLKEIETVYEKSNDAVFLNVDPDFFRKDKKNFSSDTIRHCKNLIFEENGRILGVVSFSGEYLEGLFVLPEFWNRGIGSALLNSALEGMRELRLQVYADNSRAVGFYRKHGFRIVRNGVCQMTGLTYFEMEKRSDFNENCMHKR